MPRRKAEETKVAVGNIRDVDGEVNIAGGDIIKTIKTIYQRALTAAEEASRARKIEGILLAQGVSQFAQNLVTQASQSTEGDSPYKGLLAYNLNEAEIFFGRNQAKKDLLKCIKQDPLTVLHAESGAGKSSLLQAGIAAYLISEGYLAIRLRSYNADPVDFIKRTFLPELSQAPTLEKASLREFLRQVCAILGSKATLYLLLDQFEEFFNPLTKEARQPFLESLADCLNDSSLRVRWVLAIRAEALSDLAELESFGIAPFKNLYRLNRLSREEAQEAISEPAKRSGITFEPALIGYILDTLSTNNEITPTHLQLVCSALSDDMPEDNTLTLSYYTDHAGGTEGILRDYLKRQLEHLPTAEQVPAWKVLRALITADRLRAVKTHDEVVEELKLSGVSKEQIDTLLARLVERRLLATQLAATETFELAHDYLIKEIELDPQEQARKAAQELLDQETRAYQRHKTLLTPERLAVIEPYWDQLRCSAEEKALLDESQKAVQAERRAQERRRNLTLGLSVAVAVGMFILALWGFQSSQDARQQAIVSRAGELAAQSVAMRDKDFRLSLLLGVEAFDLQRENIQARGALRDAANAYPQLLQFLTGYSESVASAVFSPDGKLIASGHVDGSIILWDVKTGQPIGKPLGGHMRRTSDFAFSSDSRLLASVGEDGIVFLWDVASQKEIGQLPQGEAGSVFSITFSPTDQLLATSGEKLILWDIHSDQQPPQLAVVLTRQGSSYLAFSPDGKTLASVGGGIGEHTITLWDIASHQTTGPTLKVGQNYTNDLAINKDNRTLAVVGDNQVSLWDIASPQPIGQPLIAEPDSVYSVAFSPDGKTLATGNQDDAIHLWDIASRKQIRQLTGHTSFVNSVAFSPDGTTLVSAGIDNTLRLWTVASRQLITGRTLSGFTKSVSSVVFSPDSKMVASIGDYNTIILWHIASPPNTGQFLGTANGVSSLAFSPDGKMLASNDCGELDPSGICKRSEITLWDLTSGKTIGPPLVGHAAPINSIAFSPDGKILASGSEDKTIILWDVVSRQPIGLPLPGHTAGIKSVAFSLDGKILASGSDDKTIILWDVALRQRIGQPLKGHAFGVNSVAFSPDGKLLASGPPEENIIFLWNIASSHPSGQPLTGHTNAFGVYSVAFSPDGRTLASDGAFELILWDVSSRQPIGQTITSQGSFNSVAFSPDGKTLATGGSVLTLWDLDPNSWIDPACQRAGGNFTLAEWDRYFPNETYRKTCKQWQLEPEVTSTPTP